MASAARWALMHELRGANEPDLPALLARMSEVDLVLVEGFKRDSHPKIEVFRAANGKPPLHPEDPSIVAIASDMPFPEARLSVLDLDDAAGIADAVLREAVPLDHVCWHAAPSARPVAPSSPGGRRSGTGGA